MKRLNNFSKVALLLTLLTVIPSCKKEGITFPLIHEANEFIWQGMRIYYFWQPEVPDLADDRFDNSNELNVFLNQFDSPESTFDHFIHQDDRFSWIVDDFEVLDNALQGISESFGYEYNIVRSAGTDEVFGYVEYVLPDSPAEGAGLVRGDVFHSVNGTQLTNDNFIGLLRGVTNQTLGLGNFVSENEGVVDNGETVSMVAVQISENPVFLTKTFDVGGTKVGYLVYNQFISTFHSELNEAFGQLKSEGVTEMVLDLRYNPGGKISTSRMLASMLFDDATVETVLGSIIYNSRLSEFNSNLNFMEVVPILSSDNELLREEPMNRLDLSRLFILTSGSTASASEIIIAGLQPFMDITLIGTRTVGKNVGSITLYDSPEEGFTSKVGINPNHKYAMQPIISQIANSVGFTDYIDGFSPNIEIDEQDFIENLKPLGDVDEPLLAEALSIISGAGRRAPAEKLNVERIYNSRDDRPFSWAIIDSVYPN